MRAPLNLASDPFRNETLPALLFGIGSFIVFVLTVQHVRLLVPLLPSGSSALHQELDNLEKERARLRAETSSARAPKTDPSTLAQWTLVKDLVDRRAFSWTGLLARLEDVLPAGVRLVSVAPRVEEGKIRLEVTAQARSDEEGWDFIKELERRAEFEDVYTTSVASGNNGPEFVYTMRYRTPERSAKSPVRATSPAALLSRPQPGGGS